MLRANVGAVFAVLGLMVGCQLWIEGDRQRLGRAELDAACADVTCKADEHCEFVQVICAKAPCELVAECVPDSLPIVPFEADGGEQAPAPAADGTQPADQDASPAGEDAPPSSCAAVLCAPGTYCDDLGGQAKCLPAPSCEGVACGAGEHCELQEVMCIRAPCPPQPACVPDAAPDPCARKNCPGDSVCRPAGGKAVCQPPGQDVCANPCLAAKCTRGTHCEAQEVQCVTEPCCAVAVCVADEAPHSSCGANTCGPGTYCCNASCGICAPKGGVCTLQVCESQL